MKSQRANQEKVESDSSEPTPPGADLIEPRRIEVSQEQGGVNRMAALKSEPELSRETSRGPESSDTDVKENAASEAAGDAALPELNSLAPSPDAGWVDQALSRLAKSLPTELRATHWSVGDTLNGRYELIEKVGEGGFGIVFRARDQQLSREVAIKMLHPSYALQTRYRTDFEKEARAAAQVFHEHIITVYSVETAEDGSLFLVMELLRALVLPATREANTLREVARMISQAARGLAAAHRAGLIHCDIKRSNLLQDATGRIKLSDFGLARLLSPEATAATLSHELIGTLAYMSPEQMGRVPRVDVRSDIYSLGVVLFELVAGTRPFHGTPAALIQQTLEVEPPPLRRYNPSCPVDLATIAEKCLRKGPQQRYARADELADDLDRWLEDRPILARPVGRVERTVRWSRRNPVVASLAALNLLVALLASFFAVRFYLETQRLDQALSIGFQLLNGAESGEFRSIDDVYSGLLQGKQLLTDDQRPAVRLLFLAASELQTAAKIEAAGRGGGTVVGIPESIVAQVRAAPHVFRAKDYLYQALDLAPDLGIAWLLLAQVRREILNEPPEQVLPDWHRAVTLLPDCSAARSGRGWTYLVSKQWDAARADFERAIQLDECNDYAQYGLGKLYYHHEQHDLAIKHLEIALTLPPRFRVSSDWGDLVYELCARSHWQLAIDAFRAADRGTAWKHLFRALELHPLAGRELLWADLLIMLEKVAPEDRNHLQDQLANLSNPQGRNAFTWSRDLIRLLLMDEPSSEQAAEAAALAQDLVARASQDPACIGEFQGTFSQYWSEQLEKVQPVPDWLPTLQPILQSATTKGVKDASRDQ